MSDFYTPYEDAPPVLRYLAPAQREKLLGVTETYKFSPGEHMIFDSDSESIMFLIEEGEADVKDGDTLLISLVSGDIVGHWSFLTGRPRTADVIASTPAIIRFFEPDRLTPLLQQDNALAARFFYGMAQIVAKQLSKPKNDSFVPHAFD